MRTLFLLLVLVNVASYAWWRYVSPAESGTDPAPLARQIEPDKMKVVATSDLPAPVPRPAPALSGAAPAALPAAATKCIEWGSFTLTDAPRAEKALEPLGLGSRLTQRRTEENAGWWVYVPPQGNRAAAAKKAAELKALGVTDYFIVQDDGENRWALSLGVFRTEDGAQGRLAALQAQGVRSAQIGRRDTVVPKVWLQVKAVEPPLEARLRDIAREMEGSELRPCP